MAFLDSQELRRVEQVLCECTDDQILQILSRVPGWSVQRNEYDILVVYPPVAEEFDDEDDY